MKYELVLSYETTVKIHKEAYGDRRRFLAIIRQREDEDREDTTFLSAKATEALYNNRETVMDLLNNHKDGHVRLTGRQYMTVSQQCVEIHCSDIPGKGFILSLPEWQIMQSKLMLLSLDVRERLWHVWQYKYRRQWYFGNFEEVGHFDDVRVIDFPKIEDVFYWMYIFLVRSGVCYEKRSRCLGCKNRRNRRRMRERGNQITQEQEQEQDQGHSCGQPWSHTVDEYTALVCTKLNEQHDALEKMLLVVLGKLGIPPPFSLHDFVKEELRSAHHHSGVATTLCNADEGEIPTHDYVELFNRVRAGETIHSHFPRVEFLADD